MKGGGLKKQESSRTACLVFDLEEQKYYQGWENWRNILGSGVKNQGGSYEHIYYLSFYVEYKLIEGK